MKNYLLYAERGANKFIQISFCSTQNIHREKYVTVDSVLCCWCGVVSPPNSSVLGKGRALCSLQDCTGSLLFFFLLFTAYPIRFILIAFFMFEGLSEPRCCICCERASSRFCPRPSGGGLLLGR